MMFHITFNYDLLAIEHEGQRKAYCYESGCNVFAQAAWLEAVQRKIPQEHKSEVQCTTCN